MSRCIFCFYNCNMLIYLHLFIWITKSFCYRITPFVWKITSSQAYTMTQLQKMWISLCPTQNSPVLHSYLDLTKELPRSRTVRYMSIYIVIGGSQESFLSQPILPKPLPSILHIVEVYFVYIPLQPVETRYMKSLTHAIVKNKDKARCWMLTEIIPHNPQKRWLARVYLSTSWSSSTASSSMGCFPVWITGIFHVK